MISYDASVQAFKAGTTDMAEYHKRITEHLDSAEEGLARLREAIATHEEELCGLKRLVTRSDAAIRRYVTSTIEHHGCSDPFD